MKLRPLSDRIVVERIAGRDQTDGGLFLPDSVKEKERPQLGLVLAVGPGKKILDSRLPILDSIDSIQNPKSAIQNREPMDVAVGDLVLFTRYCGHEQELGRGVKVLVMSEGDVLAVVEPDGPPEQETAAE